MTATARWAVYQTMTGDYGGADAMASLKPITKYCTYATTPEEAVYGTQMAVKHAALPRHGPAAVVMKTSIIRAEMPETPKPVLYPSGGYLPTPRPGRTGRGGATGRDDRQGRAAGDHRRQRRLSAGCGAALQALAERPGRWGCHQLQRQGRDRRNLRDLRRHDGHLGPPRRQPGGGRRRSGGDAGRLDGAGLHPLPR